MKTQQFEQAQTIIRKIKTLSKTHREFTKDLDSMCMKAISMGSPDPEIRPFMRKLFAELEPVVKKMFEKEISNLETEFEKL